MPIPNDDERFERYLKQFHPVEAEPLPSKRFGHTKPPMVFAGWTLAVAAVFAIVVLILHLPSKPPFRPPDTLENMGRLSDSKLLTLGGANTLLAHAPSVKAAADSLAFQSQTTQLSKGRQSALAVLTKENIKL